METRDEKAQESDYAFSVNTVVTDTVHSKCVIGVKVGGVSSEVLVDSGSTCNIVNMDTWEALKRQKIVCTSEKSDTLLYAYGSRTPLHTLGKFTADIEVGRRQTKAEFVVVQGNGQPILGCQTAEQLGILKVGLDINKIEMSDNADIVDTYKDCFEDEVLQNMNQSTVYSQLDLKYGFHQIELEPDSRGITTFATHKGLLRYKRLMFGISSAPELYQHIIQQEIQWCEGAHNISDKIIVHGRTMEEHDQRLVKVFERLREKGLTLNKDKCEFRMLQLVFMGHILSEKGIGPAESKVKAITEAREPESAAKVRSFLRLVNFCARYIPDMTTTSEPMRRLVRKSVPFTWGWEQKQSFQKLKQKLVDADTLAFFDKDAKTQIVADVSPVGLGAVLLQEQGENRRVVSYASRSLTDVERRYSQTEKEALTLVWACERFHAYLYEPLKRTVLPTGPWQDLAADLLGPMPTGEYLLVVVDYYSRYFEIDVLKSVTSEKVIASMDNMFTTHGLASSVKTDNGPQFVSDKFESYMKENDIEHRKSTPLWPQANGEVERQNRTLYKSMKIAQAQNRDWKLELNKFLTAYRSTPHTSTGVSPAELLFGRKIRTK
ncbi:PREDICTED: uncharacterized protein K02A2.6-like [Priapulus caudatus]|uniref:Uncharacterized protein K02A2.6-like n=1 Tax=Priapulus caudatus TaxID=37621 RepID=A0ABM1F0L0_PRICU|nr:PREDICTED: uncharacterized protein K02A2.6-like [Priapulus caudatus]